MKTNRKMPKNTFRSAILAFIFVIPLILASCSPYQVQPEVKIIKQADIAAGDVTISVDLKDFDVGDSGQGRIIYYLDAAVPTYYAHSPISKAGTFAISQEKSYTWKDITPGEHKFSVQLVDNANSPLPVPVVDSMTVNVGAPKGTPQLSIVNPADGSSLPPGNILVSFDVGNFLISRQDMGVVNRKGEGHLIFYLDEKPPVDAGVPATTDTSIVSTELSHLWKAIGEGKHTFSAQLVNNDDTPLDTPVVVTINLDVAAGK